MYRLLATDIDDTILGEDGSLPEKNHRALEDLHRRGVTIVLSSGRATVSMQEVASRIVEPGDDEYLIAYNGAKVVKMKSGIPVREWLITADVAADILAYTREHGVYVQGYAGGRTYTDSTGPDTDLRRREYEESTGMHVGVVPDLLEITGPASPKLLIIDDADRIPRHAEELEKRSRGRYRVPRSKPHYLEIIHPAVSKGNALRELARELGIPIEETVAVGDSFNDIEMVTAAGLGLAVANARDELKAVADIILDRTAGEGAIAEIAERFF
jgi:Cof subfamily protein (haloacid dehalogenase superfamily)